jgi:peptidyl-prolyl cis-trans isomerase A (cyclophilin A)
MVTLIDRRGLIAAGLALSAAPALGAEDDGLVRVALKTTKGVIVLDLEVGKAPITARHFLKYVDEKRYDGACFYRAARTVGAPDTGVIQGGLRSDASKMLGPIAHESTLKTGLSHKDGTISLGRRAPGTANSEFFICVGDQTYLDADPTAKGDNLGFAAFGHVVDGMDHVHTILGLPTSPTAGVGVMRGQMLSPTVPILTARRAPKASV